MQMASSSISKDPNLCPICLEPVIQEAYLDRCFHTFCYPCIIYWSNVVKNKSQTPLSSVKCPLCKTENFSIIHDFNGEHFQRHYVIQSHNDSFLSSAHKFRLHCYNNNIRIPNDRYNIQLYWKQRRYLRRNVWFESWLKREIQALMGEQDVDIIAHHVNGVIDSFLNKEQREGVNKVLVDDKRKDFRGLIFDAARPFLSGRTERFVDEVEVFLVLGFNIEAYDDFYMQFLSRTSVPAE